MFTRASVGARGALGKKKHMGPTYPAAHPATVITQGKIRNTITTYKVQVMIKKLNLKCT